MIIAHEYKHNWTYTRRVGWRDASDDGELRDTRCRTPHFWDALQLEHRPHIARFGLVMMTWQGCTAQNVYGLMLVGGISLAIYELCI